MYDLSRSDLPTDTSTFILETNSLFFFYQELKMKLRRLREKLRKLKSDYQYSEDEEETEKSEMDTLKDLKKATEQAIRELQVEAVKANKRKGKNSLLTK